MWGDKLTILDTPFEMNSNPSKKLHNDSVCECNFDRILLISSLVKSGIHQF